MGKSHKTYSSSTPEKERGSSPEKELLLNLTQAKEVREELNNTDLEEFPEKKKLCQVLLSVNTANIHLCNLELKLS